MGDAADDAMERAIGLDFFDRLGRLDTRVNITYRWGAGFQQSESWTMKNGEEIALTDMTPSHRGNVARMLERKAKSMKGLTVESLRRTPLYKKLLELGIE